MKHIGCQDGAAIRRIREERNRTPADLAASVGIRRQSLYNIELGNKPAGLAVLVRIARELRVPVDRILKDGEEADAEEAAAL
jgi:transcriptional regulator with XRE-family HTH domain